jgi:hypothetical protein
LRTNGTVAGWGYNVSGQASPPANLVGVSAIAAGYLHSVALLTNGTVVSWGDNTFGQTNLPGSLSNIVAIAAGDFHTYALRADGAVFAWGDDSCKQLEVPALPAAAIGIASGNYHGLALLQVMPMVQASLADPSHLLIRWTGYGVLQSAPTPTGPYTDIICTGRCFTNTDMSASARFFRLRR